MALTGMRFLILNADYPKFLISHYEATPRLSELSYAEQMAARNASLFGVADFYSHNFRAHGHEAADIHVNNPWLQYRWAREHGVKVAAPSPIRPDEVAGGRDPVSVGRRTVAYLKPVLRPIVRRFRRRPIGLSDWEATVLRAQIEEFCPDIILNQEMTYVRSPVLRSLKRPGRQIIGQIASTLPKDESFDVYDLLISSLPNLVQWFRARNVRAELNRLAFEPSVLSLLGQPPPRDIALSFVGSLSPVHRSRIAFLEYVAQHAPLKIWGNGIERIPRTSVLRSCYQGEAWGREMYEILQRSRITLNHHIDLAENWANNMRLYEATGAGALLLTDQKRNLQEMFALGEHVTAYESPEDCVRQINLFLANEPLRASIAAKGQRHTINTHNYFRRTGEIVEMSTTFEPRTADWA